MKKGFTLIELLIVIAIGAILVVVLGHSLGFVGSGPDRAWEALQKSGYTNIQLGGHALWSCGRDDAYFPSREFSATNPQGKMISGAVCCGYWKGCTIRL